MPKVCAPRILEEQEDPQNLHKWKLCQSKLLQERLLVQQLEAEASLMHFTNSQGRSDSAASSDTEDRQPAAPGAKQVSPLQERNAGNSVSLLLRSNSASEKASRRQSLPQRSGWNGSTQYQSPLRRSSVRDRESHSQQRNSEQADSQQRRRAASPPTHNSSPSQGALTDDSSGMSACDALPCMRHSSSIAKDSAPARRTPVSERQVSCLAAGLTHDRRAEEAFPAAR